MVSSTTSSAALRRSALKLTFVALAILFAVAGAEPVAAQDQQRLESLVNRLDRMERDMGALSRQVYSGGTAAPKGGTSAPSGGSAAPTDYLMRLESRISDLESQVTQLTGNLETLTHANSELTAQIDRMGKDNELRFKELEKGGGTPSVAPQANASGAAAPAGNIGTLNQRDIAAAPKGGAAPAAAPTQQRASLPAGSPQQQYDYAYGLIDKARSDADYANAAQAFQDFLDKNPSGPLASNARYWMGETYYVRKDYNGSARVFLEAYQKDQKGPKAPDTLLKLGMSLTNLDKKKEACATFDKLAKDFPDASANIKRVLPRERQRAGCA